MQAECAATGAVVRKSRRGVGVAVGGSSVKAPKPAGTYEVSRAVQRAAPASTSAHPSAPPPHADADAESLRRAAVQARGRFKVASEPQALPKRQYFKGDLSDEAENAKRWSRDFNYMFWKKAEDRGDCHPASPTTSMAPPRHL